jgi:hypothetical protein
MKLTGQWDKIFSEIHLHSWPTATITIQNVNPSPSQRSRNIFEEDEKEILKAAAKYGYVIIKKGKIVTFMHPTLKGIAGIS